MTADHGSSAGPADTSVLVEAGLLGAAVVSIVGVLRRRQARHRPAGRRIRLPGPEVAATEVALRRTETPERMPLVERAMAALVSSLRQQAATPPAILGVVVDDDQVEVLLAHPGPPPSPWTASAEGFRWRIPASAVPADPSQESAPLPALALLGRVASGTADALINLEAAGLLGVHGDATQAAGLLYALATHLIGAPWARAVTLILVGFPPGLAALDNVRIVATLKEVAAELLQTADVMTSTAQQSGCPDVVTGRLRGLAGDGWPPLVVLSARPPDPDESQLLAAVAQPGRGVAAVVVTSASNVGAGWWEINAGARPCPVIPLRVAVEPTVLAPDVVAAIAELIRVADDTSGATLEDPPYNRIQLSVEHEKAPPGANGTMSSDPRGDRQPDPRGDRQPDPRGDHQPDPRGDHQPDPRGDQRPDPRPDHRPEAAESAESSLTARLARLAPSAGTRTITPAHANGHDPVERPHRGQPPILVRVLGSVEIEGAADFKRAKSRELAVYLAMHPNGVGESELDEALWGSSGTRVVASSTRDATVSVARTALGGAARLLPAQGQGREKRYQLGPEVQSDWSQFCALHHYGREHQSVAALHEALELVRGRPFEAVISGRTYGWLHTEGHGRHIEAEVADAADLAAGLHLQAGDPRAARWSARRGLLAEPYTERLWVRLMQAADALGESQEIERIMDEMDIVLELEGDFTGLHPNTLATYDRLSRRHRHPAAT